MGFSGSNSAFPEGEYGFGPADIVGLRLTGDAAAVYGSYDDLSENVQEALQMMCHAVLQLDEAIESSAGETLMIDDAIWIVKVESAYMVNNWATGMTVFQFKQEGVNRYSMDFFSLKEMAQAGPLIEAAYRHMLRFGRRK